jgi:ferrous iron transport protein B
VLSSAIPTEPVNGKTHLVAVVGNPNAGKTSLFNALTGSHQKVGNYPGVTVERVSSIREIGEFKLEIVDVPGLYSLEPVSADERVAVDALLGERNARPDLVICTIDSSNLERNLYLFTQIAELQLPLIVVLTMTDVLESKGKLLDTTKLSSLLGVEVVSVIAHKRIGIKELESAILKMLVQGGVSNRSPWKDRRDEPKLVELKQRIARSGIDMSDLELYELLSASVAEITTAWEEHPDVLSLILEARLLSLETSESADPVAERYKWTALVQKEVISTQNRKARFTVTDRIDFVLTHRFWGLGVFIGVMYVVFQSIYSFAEPIMGWIEGGFSAVGEWVAPWFANSPAVQSLVVDGVIGGVGGALAFLPQIMILFLFIALLEGSGYLARAAFLMDKLLGWAGLNGRAFIPLLSSFACAIPGIMAARVMPDPKSRLATILVAPLMSCSARLPVYLLLIGAVIEPKYGAVWAGVTLFAMHFLGLLVAIPVVLILNKRVVKGKRLPFHLELPPYQWPKWRDVWISMYIRAKTFLQTAGTIIVVMSIIIWALLYFPRSQEADQRFSSEYTISHPQATELAIEQHVEAKRMENSYLGQFGRTIEPALRPAGFDWRLSTAILSAFPAREVVVASMGVLFQQGSEASETSPSLRNSLREATWPDGKPLITVWSATSLMVFFALCCQCMATLATVRRETGTWKWPVFMFSYMTGLAYIFSVAIFQFGQWYSTK